MSLSPAVRSCAKERMCSGARLDVLIFRLRSYCVLIYTADFNGPKIRRTLMFLGQAGTFLSFQARRSSATHSSTSDLTGYKLYNSQGPPSQTELLPATVQARTETVLWSYPTHAAFHLQHPVAIYHLFYVFLSVSGTIFRPLPYRRFMVFRFSGLSFTLSRVHPGIRIHLTLCGCSAVIYTPMG